MNKLVQAITDMREEEALRTAKEMLGSGVSPVQVLADCREAMNAVGEKFEKGEYFVSELILAGEILKSISAEVRPHLQQTAQTRQGPKVLLGTVKGDIHDIGKDIVSFMLDVNNFQVTDLGVDVAPSVFVEQIKQLQPPVVALSGFLTLSFTSMKETVEAIAAAGLRNKVKIMIGGGTVDEQVRSYAGADAFGKDAMAAVELAKQWTEGKIHAYENVR
ncbi:MAG TPA: cobalamin-dependent protein [Spirochaetia bacterium]|nr:cobalamin-dependent protein [Spirochaetia bacterium]